jgi:hypothetical protein
MTMHTPPYNSYRILAYVGYGRKAGVIVGWGCVHLSLDYLTANSAEGGSGLGAGWNQGVMALARVA